MSICQGETIEESVRCACYDAGCLEHNEMKIPSDQLALLLV